MRAALFIIFIFKNSDLTYIVDSTAKGKVFDGIGAISGGGATSKLLYSINETMRQAVLRQLFRNGVQILKVEIGGDDQSTDGSEASHWPEKNVFAFERGYEWRLIKEAREINPSLKICILPWAFPRWVGGPIDQPRKTARYVISWIKEAEKILAFTVNCVGLWNERRWSENHVKILRELLIAENCSNVRIVVADNYKTPTGDFQRMLEQNVSSYVDVIGVHYPGGILPEFVRQSGKTLWASEDYSTLGDGFGCMARTLNANYVHGNMTATIVWHLASAFYDAFPYFGAGLMSPRPPHYANYFPTPAFYAFWATSAFTRPGWHFLRHGRGSGILEGNGTYVSYMGDKDLTIVVETMSWSRSQCMYSTPKSFKVAVKQKIAFQLMGEFSKIQKMYLVKGDTSRIIEVKNGRVDLGSVNRDSLLTLSTLPPPPFPVAVNEGQEIPQETDHVDNFSDYSPNEEPRWLSPQKGTWIVEGGILVQKVKNAPVSWCSSEIASPFLVMPGSSISVDVLPPSSSESFVFLGLKTNCFGCLLSTCQGIFAAVNRYEGFVFENLENMTRVADFPVSHGGSQWKRFSILVENENTVVIHFGKDVHRFPWLIFPSGSMVALGTTSYFDSYWDNILVKEAFV